MIADIALAEAQMNQTAQLRENMFIRAPFDGTVISICLQDSLADLRESPVASYIVAHDLRDGHVAAFENRVAGDRPPFSEALVRTKDGRELMVLFTSVLAICTM